MRMEDRGMRSWVGFPLSSILNPLSSFFILCVSVSPCLVSAEDWPQWRGPRGDGSSLETNVPTKWSATQNVKWKVPIPGKGHGSASIVEDRVYLNTAIEPEKKRVLLCLDRKDGRTV